MKCFTCLLIIMFSSLTSIHGQKYVLGKVNKELLEMKHCTNYPDANAIIAYRSGSRSLNINGRGKIENKYEYRKQIKLLDNNVESYQQIKFTYFCPSDGAFSSHIAEVKGKVYYLRDGKIVEVKVIPKLIVYSQADQNHKAVSLTLPKLQNGCVIEYSYTILSNWITNIDNWEVQDSIPILYDEFYLEYPEFFDYQLHMTGAVGPTKDMISSFTKNKELTIDENSIGYFNKLPKKISTDIPYKKREFSFENIPPFKPEKFVANKYDGRGILNYQLKGYDRNEINNIHFLRDYTLINNKLLTLDNFGQILQNGEFITDMVDISSPNDKMESAKKIYAYFVQNIDSVTNNNIFSTQSTNDLFLSKKGTIGDLGLNYIAALNHVGIHTIPVLLSTRGNGTLHPSFGNIFKFNYLVALSEIDGVQIWSDVGSKLPFGQLSTQCLNGDGWKVAENKSGWVAMKSNQKGNQIFQSQISMGIDKLVYNNTLVRSNYFYFDDSKEIAHDLTKYYENNWMVPEFHLDSLTLLSQTASNIKVKSYLSSDQKIMDSITIRPFLILPYDMEDFEQEIRHSMVDLPYMQDFKFSSSIILGLDYSYDVPPNTKYVLGENEIFFTYATNYNESINTLNISADLKINKTTFAQNEYQDLRDVMLAILSTLSKSIVIKRK